MKVGGRRMDGGEKGGWREEKRGDEGGKPVDLLIRNSKLSIIKKFGV
jgi:hypothetical protein